MGNLIPICYLLCGSHIGPPRGGSKSHHKNRSVKNKHKINKLSENVQKNDSRGHPGGDQRSNIFLSFSVLGPLGDILVPGVGPKLTKCAKMVPKSNPKGPKFKDFASFFVLGPVADILVPAVKPKLLKCAKKVPNSNPKETKLIYCSSVLGRFGDDFWPTPTSTQTHKHTVRIGPARRGPKNHPKDRLLQ